MERVYLRIGSIFGGFGVALLAAASHAAPDTSAGVTPEALRAAALMLLLHAPVVFSIPLWREKLHKIADIALILIMTGVFFFAGEIVLHAYAGIHLIALAPIGGSLTIAGWVVLGFSPRSPL
jgi:uncharacterized membrane protein YgdD (TMEM256/DUF423 family)